ncbi:LytR family transcriptional regulator [Candidatus Saccharibacteria bacterium]|nr:LytR family transcriptional regulator [Candidatus Saccharibacteria bacterium]
MSPKIKKNSVDGFVVRRRTADNNEFHTDHSKRPGLQATNTVDLAKHDSITNAPESKTYDQPKRGDRLNRSEIDDSLNAVGLEEIPKRKARRYRKPKKKVVLIIVGLIILGFVGYFLTKFILNSGRVFSGNLFDLLGSGTQIKQDEKGWTNILVFGTSEDGPNHAGAALTDSIMMISVHQEDKKVTMISVPRDLWVDYGRACLAGFSGKINALYSCGVESGGESEGASLLKEKVGEVFGVDMHYFTKVNYSVVRDLTTALGGVVVTVSSDDPRGIYDYNTKLKLPNGQSTLQGEQALAFVRARGDGGGYGFEGSNFVREKNQQAMILAIRDKALSAGTLTNPVAWSGILDAMGSNIRSDFSAGEIKTLVNLAEDVKQENIVQVSLVEKGHPVVTTGSMNGASIVRPIAGIKDYSDIQKYIARKMSGGENKFGESATIEILNASTRIGIAGRQQTMLEDAGFVDVSSGDTNYMAPSAIQLYDTTLGKMPKTLASLEENLGVKSLGSTLPVGVQSDADFVILLGDGVN